MLSSSKLHERQKLTFFQMCLGAEAGGSRKGCEGIGWWELGWGGWSGSVLKHGSNPFIFENVPFQLAVLLKRVSEAGKRL